MKPVALITGGCRGIGLGIAQCLAEAGYDLALCGVRSRDRVAETLGSLAESGSKILYVEADVSDPEARFRLVSQVKSEFNHLNLLVNNAGVAPKERADILDASEESFEWVLKVNLQGPYFLTQAIANWMIEQRARHPEMPHCIINISSISATVASVNRGEYCISKAGIAMASKLWAVRLAEQGISVFEVRPGLIQTDMTSGVKEKYDDLIGQGLLLQSRWGLPRDVGRAVVALSSGDFSYSTGQVIMVDGGMLVERL